MSILTENITIDLITIVTAILVATIVYLKWKLTYWEKVGLPTLNPTILFGDTKDLLLARKTFSGQFAEFYKKFKARGLKHGGVYMGTKPFYVPVDPEIIKRILRIDFQHFVNHGQFIDETTDPFTGHLFNLEDAKWRKMRVKLTPTFTSGKMKMMFQTLTDCTVGLQAIIDDSAENEESIEMKDVMGRFTTDVIGSIAFGLDCNSFKDPNSLFRAYGIRIFNDTTWERLKRLSQFIIPRRVLKAMKFKLTKPDVETFFMRTIRDTVSYREQNNVYRKDFMHLLLQLKNRGAVTDDEKVTEENGKNEERGLTINELAAQAYVFFIAGFETSSTAMTFALFELATNPHLQDKLREEINAAVAKHQDRLTYDAITEMTYMDKVLYETLRKYPPVPILIRQCSKDYMVPNTNIRIEKGTNVLIPILGLQSDPEYYPDPEIFDPERFSEENKKTRPEFTWLPFGEGPRMCIGLRFGMLQSKVGLAVLLKNHRIKLSAKTKVPLKMDPFSSNTAAEGGIWIDVKKLNQ